MKEEGKPVDFSASCSSVVESGLGGPMPVTFWLIGYELNRNNSYLSGGSTLVQSI